MSARFHRARAVLPLIATSLALTLAGCGTDDIQFNGGVFDAVGLSESGKSKSGVPKVAERAPLVVPPSLDRLPAPGEAAAEPTQIAGITDPDEAKKKSQAELEKQQAEYCQKNYTNATMRGEEASMVEGPLGPCRPSVLSAIKKYNGSDDGQ
jgi:hypothetical protein